MSGFVFLIALFQKLLPQNRLHFVSGIGFLGYFFVAPLQAQQASFQSQYNQNFALLNPAAIGISPHFRFTTGFRTQWSGWEGAPQTAYFLIESPLELLKDKSAAIPENGHSLAFSAHTDKAGLFSRSGFYAQYAYHLTLSQRNLYDENTRLQFSMGASLGLLNVGFQSQDAILLNPNDNALKNQQTAWSPDLNLGLWLHDDRFFVGASVFQVIENRLNFAQATRLRRHYGFMGGYHFKINQTFKLSPSFFVQKIRATPLLVDVNLALQVWEKWQIGTSYRHRRALQAFVGGQVWKKLSCFYYYDYSTSTRWQVFRNSHEIAILYTFF
jgi:type IX secretion system PorP/SprF family membrane protein